MKKTKKPFLDEEPKECEICWEPSEHLSFNQETQEWICPKCNSDLKNEMRIYEDHFSYSLHYYMNNWNNDNGDIET